MTTYVRRVKRRGKARWVLDIRYRTPEGVTERYRRDAQVQTRAAANAEAQRLLLRLAEKGTLDPDVEEEEEPEAMPTVDDAIEQFELVELPKKKPSTQHGYRQIVEANIRPWYGPWLIFDIDRPVFLELDTELVATGLSPSTRRNIQVVFRRILGTAVDAGRLEHMPALPSLPRVGRKVTRSMSLEESNALIAASHDVFKLPMLLARDAGLRASEVRGLRWKDVDLNSQVLTVRQAICHGVAAPPKSGHERVVPLTNDLIDVLEVAGEKKAGSSTPVAPSSWGTVWSEAGMRTAFNKARKKAALEEWTFHSLRHFFVSDLFRQGASAPVVRQLAGHRELSTTVRYAHANDDECRAAIAAVGASRRKPRR